MRRPLRPLAALAILALISTGCSNAPTGAGAGSSGAITTAATHSNAHAETGAASASSQITAAPSKTSSNAPAGSGSSGGSTAATRQQAVRFAECMRNNGVSEFPDPNASGQFVYGIKAGSSLDPSTAAWKKAIGVCKNLEPPGALGEGKRTAQQMQAALKFAQCMRDHGVKDFPDPRATGPLIDTGRIPSLAGKSPRSDPEFQAAIQKCRDVMAGALGGQ